MRDELVDVVSSDLAVTALAERASLHAEHADDEVLRLLQAWAADIDARPILVELGDAPVETALAARVRRRPRGSVRSIAVMTLALTVSSTGIAAAVQGNPLAPINYFVHRFGDLGDHARADPVDLGMPRVPPTDAGRGKSRDRREATQRPSRGRGADRPRREPAPQTAVADRTIEAHHLSASDSSGSGADAQRQRPTHERRQSGHSGHGQHRRHGPLIVRQPHHDPSPADEPVPSGGSAPPTPPEPPSGGGLPMPPP